METVLSVNNEHTLTPATDLTTATNNLVRAWKETGRNTDDALDLASHNIVDMEAAVQAQRVQPKSKQGQWTSDLQTAGSSQGREF